MRKEKHKEVKARKVYRCLICGKEIPKGSSYIRYPFQSTRIDKVVSEYIGSSPWDIKWKTRLFYFDRITLRFCSWVCFDTFLTLKDNLPKEIKDKIREKEDEIIKKILEPLKLAYEISKSLYHTSE